MTIQRKKKLIKEEEINKFPFFNLKILILERLEKYVLLLPAETNIV